MTTRITLSLFICIFSLTCQPAAHADFLPGRERAAAEAMLKITATSGAYHHVQKVTITQLVREGAEVSAFLVEFDGEPHRYEVASARRSNCGDLFFAREQGTVEDNAKSELVLRDYRNATCREKPAATWMMDFHHEAEGSFSALQAEGDPHPLLGI